MTPVDSNATPPAPDETARPMLRHALATLAYRGGKAVRDAPEGFAEHRAGRRVDAAHRVARCRRDGEQVADLDRAVVGVDLAQGRARQGHRRDDSPGVARQLVQGCGIPLQAGLTAGLCQLLRQFGLERGGVRHRTVDLQGRLCEDDAHDSRVGRQPA